MYVLRHLALIFSFCCLVNVVRSCTMSDEVCEFWLNIEHHLTMMDYKTAVYPANGQLYKYDVTDIMNAQPINVSRVVTSDGWEKTRLVITANQTMPGPPIEVYEGQTVVVHVKNKMTSSAVTVHWHGLHQKGTPWMDGVAFVTQCPILPGQTFTYRFKAYPRGTFWYHSHIGSQLSMGLVGAFIIREKVPPPMEEFIMMLQDWNHDMDGDLVHYQMLYGFYENRVKMSSTGSLDGSHFSMFPFQSGLINGRGRYYDASGQHNQAPLTVFTVNTNSSYRFRVIGAGSLYPFRVSIDNHMLTLVASDGYELKPIEVESFIINPGERYDFIIQTDQPVGNYWIRAETLEVNVQNHIAEGILRYEGAAQAEPTSSRKVCTANETRLVVNCPYSYYPEDMYTTCMTMGELKAAENHNTPGADPNNPEEIQDVFLNFAFPGTTWTPGSVNGRAFKKTPVSALTQPQEITTHCEPNECGDEKVCQCAHTLNLEHNKVYQMVFLNMGSGRGWAHPIHMHGHSFYVVKIGYPQYNETTGKFTEANMDVDCRGNPDRTKSFCNGATWANSSWGGNNVPGLELELPPRKDTIMVPSGGYVVVRIRADNPGLWFMHCHIELHNTDGMAMMMNESFPNHATPPHGFPMCGDFHYDGTNSFERKHDRHDNDDDDDDYDKELFWIVVGCLIAVVVIQFIIIIAFVYRRTSTKGSFNTSPAHDNPAFNMK